MLFIGNNGLFEPFSQIAQQELAQLSVIESGREELSEIVEPLQKV